ncbi:hypothetical protein BJV78DRAFT_1287694 [Lactifluus subvellereus]|nr:hypothetical protein BJV78DRAFT_1287694 [Lactifluus subvellereus]
MTTALESKKTLPATWRSSRKAASGTLKLKKTEAGEEATENEDERHQVCQPQPSAPDTPIRPSGAAHSCDEADESVGIPRAKSPVLPSAPQSPNRVPSGGTSQISSPVLSQNDVMNSPANQADREGGEDLPMHDDDTETGRQDGGVDSEGEDCVEDQDFEARLNNSPDEFIESSSSQSDYSKTRKKILWEREGLA